MQGAQRAAAGRPAAPRCRRRRRSETTHLSGRGAAQVLPEAAAAGFALADALPAWPRRGRPGALAGAERLVRVDPDLDGTDGFFVTVFERARARAALPPPDPAGGARGPAAAGGGAAGERAGRGGGAAGTRAGRGRGAAGKRVGLGGGAEERGAGKRRVKRAAGRDAPAAEAGGQPASPASWPVLLCCFRLAYLAGAGRVLVRWHGWRGCVVQGERP